MDDPQIGIGIALCVTAGALYASAASGLSALGEAHLYAIAEAPSKRGATAKAVLARLDRLRMRLLVGRTATVGVAASLATQLGPIVDLRAGAVAINLLVVLFAYGLAAVVASGIARRKAASVALPLLRWTRPLELLAAPVAFPFVLVHKALEQLVEEAAESDPARLTALAVEHMIDEGEEQGSIDEGQAEMLRSVLDFRETVAREVMVPRTRMVAFPIETPIDAVLRATVESGHSRYPVYVDSPDVMEGVLYVKDLLQVLQLGVQPDELSLRDLIRRPIFVVQESTTVGEVLREMQARRWHLAVVKDEFGATSGVVTLEDIIEEIVGEIHDEYDGDDEPRLERVSEARFDIDAAMLVDDVEASTGLSLRGDASSDTIGGLVVELAGHVPVPGTLVESPEARFTVLEADARRVRRVRLDLTEEQQAAS